MSSPLKFSPLKLSTVSKNLVCPRFKLHLEQEATMLRCPFASEVLCGDYAKVCGTLLCIYHFSQKKFNALGGICFIIGEGSN